MSGFDEPHHIDFMKCEVNELCSSIIETRGYYPREIPLIFLADTVFYYETEEEYQAALRGRTETISLEELARKLRGEEEEDRALATRLSHHACFL